MKVLMIHLSLLFIVMATEAQGMKRIRLPEKGRKLTVCDVPPWSATRENNWPRTAERNATAPIYELHVKGLDRQGRYKARTKHTIVVQLHRSMRRNKELHITGFYVTLHNTSSTAEACGGTGMFRTPKRKRSSVGAPNINCSQPLVLNADKPLKRGTGKWKAPACGEVVMRVVVRAVNSRLYCDKNVDVAEHYQVLTKRIGPTIHSILPEKKMRQSVRHN